MRDEGVIYVAGYSLLNRRCTRLPGCIRLRNDLLYIVSGGALNSTRYSLTSGIGVWFARLFIWINGLLQLHNSIDHILCCLLHSRIFVMAVCILLLWYIVLCYAFSVVYFICFVHFLISVSSVLDSLCVSVAIFIIVTWCSLCEIAVTHGPNLITVH